MSLTSWCCCSRLTHHHFPNHVLPNNSRPTTPSLLRSSKPLSQPPPIPRLTWRRQNQDEMLLDAFQRNWDLKELLGELSEHPCDPVGLLDRHGDWSDHQFWMVVMFLKEYDLVLELLQVFDAWTERERSRINITNYTKLVQLLCEQGAMRKVIVALDDMEKHGLAPTIVMYNHVVTGFASKGEFDNAKAVITKMREVSLVPIPETYNGLLRAYGDYRMYDEMSKCVKKMGLEGCFPNEATYNLIIVEYAKGGLIEKMEAVCRTLMSKRMNLLPSTQLAMLETYANLGILDDMERVYRRVMNLKVFLKERLVQKMAIVYIENYRFVRLEEFADELGSINGRTTFVWCLLLLASACLTSRKGMESVVSEMQRANDTPDISFTNILAAAYMKMKAFRNLDVLLSQIGEGGIKPDMVTFGIFFDACVVGFDGTRVLETWKRCGFLDEVAEMKTDRIVLAAFSKGQFMRNCEERYSALQIKAKEKKAWTYADLVRLVFRND